MSCVDHLILTAANPTQARGYEAQLSLRESQGRLRRCGAWQVVSDPGGKRVGSGGSTLWVLFEIARRRLAETADADSLEALFAGRRSLIIHSGGDSRRLCAYAAQGKVFTPLPCDAPEDRHPATLFDLVFDRLVRLPAPPGGQVLIAAGDVLLTFDPQEVDFDRPGVVGVAYPGTPQRASQHGVYVADHDRVVDFLQKPDEAEARRRRAVDAVGRILIDTGLISLDPSTAAAWLELAGVRLGHGRLERKPGLLGDLVERSIPPLDLYEQLLMAMPEAVDQQQYLRTVAADDADAAHRQRLARVHERLNGRPFHVNVLPYCDFYHVGTSRELLGNISTLTRTAQEYGFANFDRSIVADEAALEDAFVYNSILERAKVRIGSGVLLEATHASGDVELPGRNIVVGWPGGADAPLRAPEGVGVVALPVRVGSARRWSPVVFGVDDDFKSTLAQGGTFLNTPLSQWLASRGLGPEQLWGDLPETRRTLWDARLWLAGKFDETWRATRWMFDPNAERPHGWMRRKRLSMRELIGIVDHDRLISHRAEIQRRGDLHHTPTRLIEDPRHPAAQIVGQLRQTDEAAALLESLRALERRHDDPHLHARTRKLAAMALERFPHASTRTVEDEEAEAFGQVARSVERTLMPNDPPEAAAILPDQVVWSMSPVRLDFAGGWSDTPPICAEIGGTVLNAAVTLNRQFPVQVMAKLRREPSIVIHSIDLGRRVELRRTQEVLGYTDPEDWAALPKAALVETGICPTNVGESLKRRLERLGGGLDVTIFSAVPKGSGLGTSSIMGSTLLACLDRVVGRPLQRERLFARTSVLEQMMTTAGGWQDQVGGVTPGVKLIRTRPGADQSPSLHWVAEPGQFAPTPGGGRLLLYYTGYQRMARNILRNVVGRYLAREPEAMDLITRLKAGADAMKNDLDAGDLDAFGRGVEEYWRLKQRFDAGATNPRIAALIRKVEYFLTGKVLPGAGGGGFVFMIAHDPAAAEAVRMTLERDPPNRLARFFDFHVDPTGLSVTVL